MIKWFWRIGIAIGTKIGVTNVTVFIFFDLVLKYLHGFLPEPLAYKFLGYFYTLIFNNEY